MSFRLLLSALALTLSPVLASSQDANTGIPAPVYSGNGAPAKVCGVVNGFVNNANIQYTQLDATNGKQWICLSIDGTNWAWLHLLSPISGTTVAIGGSALLLGTSVSGTATLAGAVVGQNCMATPSDGTLLPAGLVIDCAVTAANTVTVRISAAVAGLPPSKTYNVRVIQ